MLIDLNIDVQHAASLWTVTSMFWDQKMFVCWWAVPQNGWFSFVTEVLLFKYRHTTISWDSWKKQKTSFSFSLFFLFLIQGILSCIKLLMAFALLMTIYCLFISFQLPFVNVIKKNEKKIFFLIYTFLFYL